MKRNDLNIIDTTLSGFGFKLVIYIIFSKAAVLKIYLSAIISLINDISKLKKGFQLTVFDVD